MISSEDDSMTIEPRAKRTPFDFVQAVTAMFQTSGGRVFAFRLLFWTTAGMAIVTLIALPFILPYYGPLLDSNQSTMQAVMKGEAPPTTDPDAMMAALKGMMLPGFLMMLGFWAAYAAGEAALHRKVLLGHENPKRPIRFGADELRVMLAQLGVWGAWFLVYIGGVIVIGLFAVIPVLGIILAILGVIFMMLMMVYLPVRLAPAAALSVRNSRSHLIAARHITKRRFWPLFGAYLVVFLGGYFLIYAVLLAVVILVTGDPNFLLSVYGMGDSLPSEVMAQAGERLNNPFYMIIGVLGVILYSFAYAFWLLSIAGVGAYAVKWWEQDDPVAPFD